MRSQRGFARRLVAFAVRHLMVFAAVVGKLERQSVPLTKTKRCALYGACTEWRRPTGAWLVGTSLDSYVDRLCDRHQQPTNNCGDYVWRV